MMSLTQSPPPPPPSPLPPPPPAAPTPTPTPTTTATTTSLLENKNNIDHRTNNNGDDDLISKLAKTRGFLAGPNSTLSLYQNFWCPSFIVRNVMAFQAHFQARPGDIFIASYPKSGTTWLKALAFSILNRARYTPADTPLLSATPHQLAPFAEFVLYAAGHTIEANPDPATARLLGTHVPYASLPTSLTSSDSKSRILYVCRNPLDVAVSSWHFAMRDPEWTMDDYIDDMFCKGETGFGPLWNHVLGFWRASLENPEKVLFLRYEDMKRDTAAEVKRIAEFMGCPFSEEEESGGVIGEIIELCSLKNLKELAVNKSGRRFGSKFDNKSYFRKGDVGDWVNHLTPSMAESINKVVRTKINGSGLTFPNMI